MPLLLQKRQHQSTSVQIADILTKDLDRVLHKKHRAVLFGEKPIEFISVAIPDSQKVYCRRHNEEIKRRQNTQELKAKFSEDEVQLAISQVLNSTKFSHWKLKQNQANQALKACIRS